MDGTAYRGLEMTQPDPATRRLWMAIRQATIIFLGAIEEYLGLERSIVPKHKRERTSESS